MKIASVQNYWDNYFEHKVSIFFLLKREPFCTSHYVIQFIIIAILHYKDSTEQQYKLYRATVISNFKIVKRLKPYFRGFFLVYLAIYFYASIVF